ncbi:YlxM family DNA-binding protein [Alicyclobacillus fastidiosus]
MGDLYDFYGALLTVRQRQIIEMYHLEDWSLSEIAESLEISRQAVHDQLRRAGEQLEQYESALQLRAAAKGQREAWSHLMSVWAHVKLELTSSSQDAMAEALQLLFQKLTGFTGGDVDA